MAHTDRHPVYQEDCFGCKLQTISFGTVPGAYKQSQQYDQSSVDYLFSDQQQIEDETQGVGWLKPAWKPWKKVAGGEQREGELYRWDRKQKEYVGATEKDVEKVLGGPEKRSRSFDVGSGSKAR